MYSVKFKILNLFVVIMVGYIGLYLLSWVFVESFPGPSKYLPAFLPLRLPDSVSMDGCCIITNEEFLIQPEPSSVLADILRPLNSVSAGIPSLDQVITNLDFMFDAIIHGFYHMPASVAFVSWYIVPATIFGFTNWMVSLRRHRLTKHQLSYVRARSSVRYHPRYRPVPARQKPLTFRRWVVYLGIYLISGVPLGVWWTYGSSLQLQTLMSQSGAWTMPWLACHLSALPQRIISTAGMHRLSLQSLPIWQSLACLAATTSFFCGIIMSRSRRKKRKIHRFPVSYWRRNQVRVPINPTRCYASVFVHRILMYCSVLLRLCSASVSTSWSQLPGILRTSLDMTKDGLTYGLQYKSKILPFQRPMRWIPLTFSGLRRKLVYWRSCEEIKEDGTQTPTWMMTAKNWPAILLSLLRRQIGVSPISLWRSCWVILGSRIVRMVYLF
ncbi:uncharacterized protein LOC110978201 [Acanthaster planci]|uniref:Uncharacterized protein LOC110978201 n=1 Tax=Acanthaster planci TaxID=133434 RepID=A0A8B7Y8K6_ACAPL|nr:uncharacterized protein LOC110978201 [Acanthaster planci]